MTCRAIRGRCPQAVVRPRAFPYRPFPAVAFGRLLLLLVAAATLLTGGCGSGRWTMPLAPKAGPELAWPPPPAAAKVSYLGEITGFRRAGTTLLERLTGTGGEGRIVKPVAVAVGKDGRIAVADAGRRGVHLFIPGEQRYQLLFEAGGEELQSPVGLAFDDGTLDLYVADSLLAKVCVYDAEGRFRHALDRAGGEPFGRPTGLTFLRRGGPLYVVDTTRHQVHAFNVEAGGYQFSFGGRGAGAGGLNFPTHIAACYCGNLYVTDTMNFRVQIYGAGGGEAGGFGRHGDGSGDFAMPKGIGVDRWGVVYVVDNLFDNVQLFDRRGAFLLTVGGRGTGPGEFWLPTGLSIDDRDRLYVCDTYNQRIQVFQLHDFDAAPHKR